MKRKPECRLALVKIRCLENLRVPSQGSSTKGKLGPKIKPKGIVDGQQMNILVSSPCWSQGMEEARIAKRWLSVQGRKVIQKVVESLFLRMEPQF
jgi:hypothetical protein